MDKKDHRSGPHQTFRTLFTVPKEDWKAFGDAVGDKNRAAVLRALIAWFLRKPGAKLPERPPRRD